MIGKSLLEEMRQTENRGETRSRAKTREVEREAGDRQRQDPRDTRGVDPLRENWQGLC
jgi:hypothetical protein